MNGLSRQCREARQDQVKRERLEGRWEYLGQKQSIRPGVFTAPSAWSGFLQTCPGVTLALGQTSLELSPELPPPHLGTLSCHRTQLLIQTCVKHLPISVPMQDAKNMRILRTRNQVGNTEMLADKLQDSQNTHENETSDYPWERSDPSQ